MKVQGIYSICHVASGRTYVGSAVDIAMRWHIHRHHLRQSTHHAARMQAAWADGPAAFLFSILEHVSNKKNLLIREQHWIDQLNTLFLTTGFNSCPVAGSPLGTKHSDATKAKMRAAKLGKPAPWNSRKHTAEEIEAAAAPRRGRKRGPQSAEHRAKISASRIGNTYALGHKQSAESRAKKSASMKATIARKRAALALSLGQVALSLADAPHPPPDGLASRAAPASPATPIALTG
jgi:group I intron endonuclease